MTGSGGFLRAGLLHHRHRLLGGGVAVVAGLQPVQVQHRGIVHLLGADAGRVDGQRPPVAVGAPDEARQLRPGGAPAGRQPTLAAPHRLLHLRELGTAVERHQRLAAHAPHHRVRPPAGNEIAPMRLQRRHAGDLEVVAPETDHARHDAVLDQVADAPVGGVEVGGLDGGEVAPPREAAVTLPPLVEWLHVGVQAGDELHHVEPLGRAVRGQGVELLGPAQAPAQPHPPGIGEPQEGRAVGVLQVAAAGGDPDRPMAQQWVRYVGRLGHVQLAGSAVEPAVAGIGTAAADNVTAPPSRGVAHPPLTVPGPEGRDRPLLTRGIGNQQVERDLVERIVSLDLGHQVPLHNVVYRTVARSQIHPPSIAAASAPMVQCAIHRAATSTNARAAELHRRANSGAAS